MTHPPAVPTVQCETPRLRVTRWDFAPGAATGWHRHGHDYVVVPVTEGTLKLVGAGGAETLYPLKLGVAYARPAGVEHDVINASDHPVAFVEIELLEPAR